MDLSPEERARFQAEWARGNKWGASLARKRALATVVSSVVFGVFLVPAMFTLSIRLFVLAFVAGLPLALLVREPRLSRPRCPGKARSDCTRTRAPCDTASPG